MFFFVLFLMVSFLLKEEKIFRKHWKHSHSLEDLILSKSCTQRKSCDICTQSNRDAMIL